MKFFLLLWFFAGSCLAQETNRKSPTIIASINPIYQILLAITADKNNSILIINPKLSEHNYQLKKSDVEFFSRADLVFYVDDQLETSFPKLVKNFAAEKKSYQLSKISGIKLLQRRDDPKKIDPHLWLNPQNAVKIAELITKKISEIDQKNSQKYQKNLAKFKKEIAATEKLIRSQLADVKGSELIFYHDGYQYFEEYFGVSPVKIMSQDHNRDLSLKDLRELDELTKSHQVKCIFGEVLDEKNAAQKLAQNYKIKFATLDAIGVEENSGNYADFLLKISTSLAGCKNRDFF